MEAEHETFSKTVEVQEYILPAFYATVSVPAQVPYTDGKAPITVGAQYTFGQNVKGSAVVTFSSYASQTYQRTVSVDSASTTFDVDFQQDLQLTGFNWDIYIQVTVDFTDSVTNKKASASTQFVVVRNLYKISDDGAGNFNPGLSYSYKVTVQRYDDSPAPTNTPIVISTSFDGLSESNQTYNLDSSASAYVTTPTPANSTSFSITIYYKDVIYYKYVYATSTYSTGYLQISVLTKEPKLNKEVELEISVTDDVKSVIVIVITRESISQSEVRIKCGSGYFFFTPTFGNAPTTRIIAYYGKDDNSIVCGSVGVVLRDSLPNYLNLQLTKTTVKPGTNASLTITSTDGSVVSLCATDQRVLLLKDGNDITKKDVFDNLDNQPPSFGPVFGGPIFAEDPIRVARQADIKFRRPWMPWCPAPESCFWAVDLVAISNGKNNCPVYEVDYAYDESMEMPEMEMPMAPESGDKSSSSNAPAVRKDFSETFLWTEVKMPTGKKQDNGKSMKVQKTISAKVPDSITSYIISGFALSSKEGLAISDPNPMLTVYLPFFIQATLPFSVKRGEKLSQDFYLYNYLANQSVTVTIVKNDFEFILDNPAADGWTTSDSQKYSQTFNSVAGTPKKLNFILVPKNLGFVTLKISAAGASAGDAVELKLRVVPEGVSRYRTNSTILIMQNITADISTELTCSLPPTAVSDTVSISAAVVGDILGASLHNIDSLIQMPGGCGEQNMLNFVPNIVIYKYLKATGKLTNDIEIKIKQFTESGYQTELQYRHYDGSFSAFGNDDSNGGSTWLTAYVAKSFHDATFITIDDSIIVGCLNFLVTKQNSDGSFREDGYVIHTDMQGGGALGIALTAYVTNVFTECLDQFPQYQPQRDAALAYLVANYASDDTYALGVLCATLVRADHLKAEEVCNVFLSLGIETQDELHWEKTIVPASPYSWANQPRSLDTEITSYGLLAFTTSDVLRSAKIIRYLVKQQNGNGGFESTQDTVMALQALANVATRYSAVNTNLAVTLTPSSGSQQNVVVNQNNALTLQTFQLNQDVRRLRIFAAKTGTGICIVSLSCNFYEVTDALPPRFTVDHTFVDSCDAYLQSHICLSYIPDGKDIVSNMALVRINLPSGFVYDQTSQKSEGVKKLEANKGGSEVAIYIDNLSEKTFCFDINAIRVAIVQDLKSGTIEAFDYYDSTKKASLVFPIPVLPKCAA